MVSNLHVGVLAFPFGSHAAPLLALLRNLARSAPGTHFSFFNSASSNRSIGAEVMSKTCDDVRVYQVWDGTPKGQAFEGNHSEAIGLFLEASPGNFEKAILEVEHEVGLEICCLISDAFLWFACDLAEKRGIPWVSFWAAASCSLSSHVYTHEIVESVRSTETRESQDQALQFVPPGLPSQLRIADLPPEIFLDGNPSPLAVPINKMVEKLPKSTAVVLNSFEEIDPIITQDLKSKFKHFLNVGPEILSNPTPPGPDDETGCLSWLDKQTRPRSVVYISFGTVIVPPENELLALAEALEAYQLPFLWSLKEPAKKCLPEGFLQRSKELGKIVPWAPQVRILGHANIGVFVTHGGWNSILESIAGCVPMICRPFFGDQKMNSRMVEASWKIGVRVEGVLSKGGIMKALDRLMCSEEGKVIREKIMQLKQKAVDAVRIDGSSTKNFKTLLEIVSVTENS